MADYMNNDDIREDGASDSMPDDLKRLLSRAGADEDDAATGYDPDATSDEDEEDVETTSLRNPSARTTAARTPART